MVTRQRVVGNANPEQQGESSAQAASSSLPFAVDAAMSLSPEEIAVLQDQYLGEQDRGFISTQTKFNLAWALVRSSDAQQVKEGISILMDIYESDATRRRECLYYLALGHYKLKNYTESKKFTGKLLSKEPNNMQAQSLNSMIDEDVRKEGMIGMAIAGTAVAVIGGITLAAIKSFRARRK